MMPSLLSLWRNPRQQRCFAVLLMLALLSAQWLGLEHGIAHAGSHGGNLSLASVAAQQDQDPASDSSAAPLANSSAHHSCAAFEAATLSSALSLAVHFELPPQFACSSLIQPLARIELPTAPTPFQSRAPPVFSL